MGNSAAKPTLEEQIRENKKQIRRGIREIDRERTRMERQKKQLEQDMRRYAKEGQTVRRLNIFIFILGKLLLLLLLYHDMIMN